MGQGVARALEDENARAFAHHQAVAGGVKGGTDPSFRKGAQLGKAHLGVERVGPGDAAGQHGVGAAGEELVGGELDGVERGGAGGVQGQAPAPQPQGVGQQTSREARHIAVEGIDPGDLRSPAEEPFLEGGAQPLPGQSGRAFAGQGQVADDDTDAGTVQLSGHGIVKGPFSGVNQEVEEGVEIFGDSEFRRKSGEIIQWRQFIDETAVTGIDMVRFSHLGVEDRVRGQGPAPVGNRAAGASGGTDVVPEPGEVRRIGEDGADPHDGD